MVGGGLCALLNDLRRWFGTGGPVAIPKGFAKYFVVAMTAAMLIDFF